MVGAVIPDHLRDENAKLKAENANLRNENQRLKMLVSSRETPAKTFHGSHLPLLAQQANQFQQAGQLIPRQGWIPTKANEARDWLVDNKLRSVSQNKTPLETVINHPLIKQKIEELKKDTSIQPKELVEALWKLFNELKINVNDEDVRSTIIYPLVKMIFQAKSKDEVKNNTENAVKFWWAVTKQKPDALQFRRIQTLVQPES
jgi:hypothetical protein